MEVIYTHNTSNQNVWNPRNNQQLNIWTVTQINLETIGKD